MEIENSGPRISRQVAVVEEERVEAAAANQEIAAAPAVDDVVAVRLAEVDRVIPDGGHDERVWRLRNNIETFRRHLDEALRDPAERTGIGRPGNLRAGAGR